MGKSYIENSLKRFLKRKVKITLGLVVTFMITGMVSFAGDKPVEEMNNFEKAEYYLTGLGKSNIKQGEYKDSTGKYTISVAENGDISFSGFDTNGTSAGGNVISKVPNNMISKVTKELLERGALAGELKVIETQGGENGTNTNIVSGPNGQNGTKLENKGILLGDGIGQYLNWGSKAINYGIIIANGTRGDGGGQSSLGSKNATVENYGVILSEGNGQYVGFNIKNDKNNQVYNFGYIQSKNSGQILDKVDTNTAYNYGVINSINGNGQEIRKEALNSEIRNYGLIEANKFAQSVTGETNSAYNFGVIRGKNVFLVEVKENAKAYNDGIIINESGTGIYSNDVKENAVNNGMIVINGDSITNNFTNNGIVLNSSFDVIDNRE